MSEPKATKARYKPTNWAAYNAATSDSTGIKFLGEGEWKRKKHGAEYRRQWRKVHLGIDTSSLEIRAIKVTDNSVGEASGGGAACTGGFAQPLYAARAPDNRARAAAVA